MAERVFTGGSAKTPVLLNVTLAGSFMVWRPLYVVIPHSVFGEEPEVADG